MPVAKTYKLYVDGKFPRSESGRYYPLQRDGGDAWSPTSAAPAARTSATRWSRPRNAFGGWSQASAYLRGQILYRAAEMLEGRSEQFVAELELQGVAKRDAARRGDCDRSIDSSTTPAGRTSTSRCSARSTRCASSHFNFSVLEPTGVVAILAPEASGLLGLVSNVAPAIVGGNTCVVLASQSLPLAAVSLAEVLHASDVPAGVVNVLTGLARGADGAIRLAHGRQCGRVLRQ